MNATAQTRPVAHQRLVRDQQAQKRTLFLEEKRRLAANFENARVEEIDFDTAQQTILTYEWLHNMGTTEYCFGLYFGRHLAGVVCFGRTAGTKVAASVCGKEYADKVITLCRGACVHWAHPHSASFLIARACDLMAEKGYFIFVAYSDAEAGEIGTIYQASNWLYCGLTRAAEKFRTPDGRVKCGRLVHAYTRDRRNVRGHEYRQKCTRAEMKERLTADGCEFFYGQPKHQYVGVYGDMRTKRAILKALRWPAKPYPKRSHAPIEVTGQCEQSPTESLGNEKATQLDHQSRVVDDDQKKFSILAPQIATVVDPPIALPQLPTDDQGIGTKEDVTRHVVEWTFSTIKGFSRMEKRQIIEEVIAALRNELAAAK